VIEKMSRSYKHTPVYKAKGSKSRDDKRCANRKIRRGVKQESDILSGGKSNHYRKCCESWDIIDYRSWGEKEWSDPASRKLDKYQKHYRRK